MRIPAHTLRDLLAGTVLAATRDITLPVLHTVHLRWEPLGDPGSDPEKGNLGTLVAEATDRYRMHEGTVAVTFDEDEPRNGDVLVDRRDVETLVKALPRAPKRPSDAVEAVAEVHGTGSARALVVEAGAVVHRLTEPYGATFPKVAGLWPADDDRADVDGVAVNPAFVADLAKVPIRGTFWQWRFTRGRGGRGPTLVTPAAGEEHPTITWRTLIMPVTVKAGGG